MNFGHRIKELTIELSKKANVGHIGSSLSISDLVGVVYEHFINLPSANDNERDRFILSKGHAGLALYAALYLKNLITKEQLDSYCQENSVFGVHPKSFVDYIDFSTGSLGQGVCYAVGAALAAKIQGSKRKVYCVMSDAELNEGCVWEAFLFASHHKLDNLIVMLDNNGQQALGFTKDVIKIKDIAATLTSLDWNVTTLDGHDYNLLKKTIENLNSSKIEKPHFINAITVSGKGVTYMEKEIKWHYKSMNDEEYKTAVTELKVS